MPVINSFSRTSGTDEDGGDQIGYETPRSGVATPQPDLQDKRLPGIMSYFGQVRQDTPATDMSSSTLQPPNSTLPSDNKLVHQSQSASSLSLQFQPPAKSSPLRSTSLVDDPSCDLHHRSSAPQQSAELQGQAVSHPYPTPPTSQPPSTGGSFNTEGPGVSCRGAAEVISTTPAVSFSSSEPPIPQHFPFTTTHFEQPETLVQGSSCSTSRSRPPLKHTKSEHAQETSSQASTGESSASQAPGRWYSFHGLKELTRGVFKSGPPTPTRALSTAQSSSHSEGREHPPRPSHDSGEASGTQTPRGPSGAQAPAPKGKLTIKIHEARNLRKSRDPYVVVVFQRSELISGGSRSFDEEENLSIPPPSGIRMGGIPIQRQGSDSGRPPVSIPMRSRQSSNTSISDYNTFRNRSGRVSLTNPKWDAEAVL